MIEAKKFPQVQLEHFSKSYGYGKKKALACNDISLSFCAGMVTGLLGPNGAGKTTILKALCGVHYPDEGSIKICFENEQTDDEKLIRSNTGFVPETPLLDRNLTVKETLFSSAELFGLSHNQAEQSVSNAVELCSLTEVYFQKVGTLSKGYMQRTSFAKALSHNPCVLILDEFSGGLDPAQIVQMREVIKRLADTKAIILSTHHIDEATALCENVYILSHGEIVSSGTIDEVTNAAKAHTLEQAFLSLTSGAK
jgi:ABC-2 type transport system ATP-binding protein